MRVSEKKRNGHLMNIFLGSRYSVYTVGFKMMDFKERLGGGHSSYRGNEPGMSEDSE